MAKTPGKQAFLKAREQVDRQRMYEGRSTRSGHQTYQDGYDAAASYVAELERERDLLLQAMWDARTALGFDTDGDVRFHDPSIERIARNHVREAEQVRKEWDEAEEQEPDMSAVDVVSAVVERLSAVPDAHPKPKLQVGEPVPLENGDFVIEHIESRWDGDGKGHGLVHVMLQDRKSWDRKHKLYDMLGDDIPPAPTAPSLPTIADWAKAAVETTCGTRGCDRLAGHSGVHTNGPAT